MGYNDIGCYGAEKIRTPHIDQLASEGMRFTDFYVSQAVCSASRASLMTGCYANRIGILGALGTNAKTGISSEEMTIAELLKQKNYSTAMIGKWHLGHHEQFLPQNHGFDYYFGLPYSNDMWPHHPQKRHFPKLPLLEMNDTIQFLEEQSMLTTWYTEKAVDFIDQNLDKPFFLYLAHSMPHVPLYVSDKFKGMSSQGLYGDVIQEIDWSVGEVMNTLKKNDIEKNTIVIFTSDNGPWLSYGDHAGSAYPLREGKGTAWEGGQRESCIMSWPGVIPEASICSEPAMTIDILPTIAKITGIKSSENKIDGKNIFELMKGSPGAVTPHEALFFYWNNDLHAVRSGKWKLHLPHPYTSLNGREGGKDGQPVYYETLYTDTALYDLEYDPGETVNIANDHPEIIEKMLVYVDQIRKDIGDKHIRGENKRSPGYTKGYIIDPIETEHLAKDKEYKTKYAFSPKYPGGGNKALTDGILATSMFRDGYWQGYEGEDLVLTIEMGEKKQIQEIEIGFFEGINSWIFLPQKVEISVSEDGKSFHDVAEINTFNADKNSSIARVNIQFAPIVIRYIQVFAKSMGTCPEGHPGEGGKAWLFIDEIMVN